MLNTKTNKLSAIALMAIVVGTSTLALADRSIKQQGRAAYPELAKKMNVTGTVKVEVKVAANGSVISAHAIGGHPLLIDAAVSAAKNTKFAPGEESTETITFNFTNNNN